MFGSKCDHSLRIFVFLKVSNQKVAKSGFGNFLATFWHSCELLPAFYEHNRDRHIFHQISALLYVPGQKVLTRALNGTWVLAVSSV